MNVDLRAVGIDSAQKWKEYSFGMCHPTLYSLDSVSFQ